MKHNLLAACLLTLAACIPGQAYNRPGEGELEELIRLRLSDGNQRVLDAAQAVRALSVLPADPSEICLRSKRWLHDQTAAAHAELAAATYIVVTMRCVGNEEALTLLQSLWLSLPENPTLEHFSTLLSISKSHGARDVPKKCQQQLQKLLSESVGSARKKDAPVCLESTGLGYQILANSKKLGLTIEEPVSREQLTAEVEKDFESVSHAGLLARGDTDGLAAVTEWLEGLVALQLQPPTSGKVSQLAAYLSRFSPAGTMLEAALLLRASKALKSLPGQVVAFSLDQPTIPLLSKKQLVIVVADGDGHPAELAYLSATVHDVDGTPIVRDSKLKGSGGRYHLDLLNSIGHGGQFSLALKGGSSDGIEHEGQLPVVVTQQVDFEAAKLSFMNEDGSVITHEELAAASSMPMTVPGTATVQVSCQAATCGSNPIVRISCKGNDNAILLGTKRSRGEKVVKQGLSVIQEQMGIKCPALIVEILCGDASCAQKAKKLAEVHIQGSGLDAQERPRHAPGAVITHQFRKPDKRPPQALSLLFASGAVLPAGFLLWSLARVGANVKDIPTGGSRSCYAAIFHGGLLGLIALYAAFWSSLNLLQTLPLLTLLGVLLSSSGYLLLSHQSANRLTTM